MNFAKEIRCKQKAPHRGTYLGVRTEQNSYVERFNVEECPMRCESTGKCRATIMQVFNASTEQQKMFVVCKTDR